MKSSFSIRAINFGYCISELSEENINKFFIIKNKTGRKRILGPFGNVSMSIITFAMICYGPNRGI